METQKTSMNLSLLILKRVDKVRDEINKQRGFDAVSRTDIMHEALMMWLKRREKPKA